MKTGMHHGVPFDEYRQWDGVSQSALKDFARSPGYMLWRRSNPRTQSPEMLIGSAVDCMIFDGASAYHERYTRPPLTINAMPSHFELVPKGYTGQKKADKEWAAMVKGQGGVPVKPADFKGGSLSMRSDAGRAWRDWCEYHGLTVLTDDLAEKIRGTVLAIQDSPVAQAVLTDGQAQASMLWHDEETGTLCKGRPDYLSESALVDLKTTDDASPGAFERKLHGLKYHWQAAMYLDGARACGHDAADFYFVAAEREPPHRVEVYRLDLSAIELGREEYRKHLRLYAWCEQEDRWPLSTGAIQDIGLPSWAWK